MSNNKLTRSEQARINGAKSTGPTTPAGKCKIQTTHMVHGFRSNTISIHSEDRATYDAHLDDYLARYSPIDKVESDLVGLLASQMWQIMRNNSIEVALLDLEVASMDAATLDDTYHSMDQYGRLALAFKKSAGDNAFELLRRYKSTAERAYHRALQALETMRKDRQFQPPVPAQTISTVEPEKTPPSEKTQPATPEITKPSLQLVKPKPTHELEQEPEEEIALPCDTNLTP